MNSPDISKISIHYPWQQDQWKQLNVQISEQRLPHALMLVGPEYIGKYQFALAFAQRLLCLNVVNSYACGQCKACQLVSSGNHPDLVHIEPEEQGKAIRIDSIRRLSSFLDKTAQQNGWKISIIYPAEAMNINASNALLKSLEEPSKNTLLILVCHTPSRLLATVKSRCRTVKFPIPPATKVRVWLDSMVGIEDNITELMEYSEGCPLLALQFVKTDLLEHRRQFDTLLDDLSAQKASAIVAAERCKKHDVVMMIDWIYYRLAVLIKSRNSNVSQTLIFRYMDTLLQSKRHAQSTANPNIQLLWEELFLNWQQLFSTT